MCVYKVGKEQEIYMPQENIDYNDKLASAVSVREDALRALALPQGELTHKFNDVKNGAYWRNLVYTPADVVCMVAIILTISGNMGVAAGVGTYIAGSIVRSIGKSQDKRENVRKETEGAVRGKLVEMNPDAAQEQGLKRLKVEMLAELSSASSDSVMASEIEDNRLTDMFNRASGAEKWFFRGVCGFLAGGLGFAASAVALGFAAPLTSVLAVTTLGCLGVVGMNGYKRDKVKKELQDAASDKLVALVDQQNAILPAP